MYIVQLVQVQLAIIQLVLQNMPDIRISGCFVSHGGFLGAIAAMMADAMKPTNK